MGIGGWYSNSMRAGSSVCKGVPGAPSIQAPLLITHHPTPRTPYPLPAQLLVDCEGIDAVDQGQKHSAQIFSLAVLLSSVFVYNQLGAVDAVALERLAMVCELAKRVKERSGGAGGGRGGAQVDFHPAFVWLLRDFQLQLAAGGSGQRISAATYLEEVLADVRSGGGPDEANRNQVPGREGGRRRVGPCEPTRHANEQAGRQIA
jgi:hypothetical protein